MGKTYLAFNSKCGWNLPDWEGDMEIWWTSNVSFGDRDQKEMWVPPASLNTMCRIWTPPAEFSSLSANRLSRQGKYPYWSLKSHPAIAESCLCDRARILAFALYLSFHTPVPIKAFSCHGDKAFRQSAEGLQLEETGPSWFLWDSLLNTQHPPLLLSRRSGFRRSQHNTQKGLQFKRHFF